MCINLEIINFRSGAKGVKPKGQLGTCGWSPRAWQLVYVLPEESAKEAFLEGNSNWTADQIDGIVLGD